MSWLRLSIILYFSCAKEKRGGSLLVAVNRDFVFLDLEVWTMNYLNMFIKLHVSALLLKKECF